MLVQEKKVHKLSLNHYYYKINHIRKGQRYYGTFHVQCCILCLLLLNSWSFIYLGKSFLELHDIVSYGHFPFLNSYLH